MSENTWFSSEMDKIQPVRSGKTNADQFQAVQVKPPALKINIVAGNRYPPPKGKMVPYKMIATRPDGSCKVSEVLVPVNKAEVKPSVSEEADDALPRPKSKNKKKKSSQWRWIYIKVEEPSKRLVLSVHRFADYPNRKIEDGADLQDSENQRREAYPNTQFSSNSEI